MMKLHNAMWPGVVGKDDDSDQPTISLDKMLDFTTNASVDGKKYDGVDLFLYHSHVDPEASDDAIRAMADKIAEKGLNIGTLVAPVWPGTMGGSAFGAKEERDNFLKAISYACRVSGILREHGARKYGVIRMDSAGNPEEFSKNELGNTKLLANTFREAGKIAGGHGERLAAEGEICWGGMHSWKHMIDTLEETGTPDTVGFQADLAHTYLYLLGYNAPEHTLLNEGYSDEEFWHAYKILTDKLRPWTIDFHVAQNDGSVHGSGSHDKTGRHCLADDPKGLLDITRCSKMWLKDYEERGIEHICWDGCMFDNSILEDGKTWDTILAAMLDVRAGLES
ncbi:MAG: sugar phosphate isomerase/epimerase [Akkermansiaceae bacterium]